MRLVGPRPEVEDFVREFAGEYERDPQRAARADRAGAGRVRVGGRGARAGPGGRPGARLSRVDPALQARDRPRLRRAGTACCATCGCWRRRGAAAASDRRRHREGLPGRTLVARALSPPSACAACCSVLHDDSTRSRPSRRLSRRPRARRASLPAGEAQAARRPRGARQEQQVRARRSTADRAPVHRGSVISRSAAASCSARARRRPSTRAGLRLPRRPPCRRRRPLADAPRRLRAGPSRTSRSRSRSGSARVRRRRVVPGAAAAGEPPPRRRALATPSPPPPPPRRRGVLARVVERDLVDDAGRAARSGRWSAQTAARRRRRDGSGHEQVADRRADEAHPPQW